MEQYHDKDVRLKTLLRQEEPIFKDKDLFQEEAEIFDGGHLIFFRNLMSEILTLRVSKNQTS